MFFFIERLWFEMNDIVMAGENISKAYFSKSGKSTQVLDNLSLDIKKGEFTAIMGPSGVGKSTLLYILGSLDNPDDGKINVYENNRKINYSGLSSDDLAAFRNEKIGFVFQFHHLLPEFTALENVMMPALIAGEPYEKAAEKANDLLKVVGVDIRSDHKPMELSGGEQQRVAIARALINDPLIVLADEPTGNLDKANTRSALELIQGLRDKYDITFIVATHSEEVSKIADRLLIMGDGGIIEDKRK